MKKSKSVVILIICLIFLFVFSYVIDFYLTKMYSKDGTIDNIIYITLMQSFRLILIIFILISILYIFRGELKRILFKKDELKKDDNTKNKNQDIEKNDNKNKLEKKGAD